MDAELKKTLRAHNKLQNQIVEKAREHAAETDEARRGELKAELDCMIAERMRLEENMDSLRAASAGVNYQIVRSDQPLIGSGASRREMTLEDIPTSAQIAQRHRLLRRLAAGETLSDEQMSEAHREYPVERLMVQRMGHMAKAKGAKEFTEEQDRAWQQYQANLQAFDRGKISDEPTQFRYQFSPVLDLSAGFGGEAIPTLLEAMFWPRLYNFAARPMANDANLTVRRLPFQANLDIPLLGGTPAAVVVAAGMEGAEVRPTTSSMSFSPVKYAMHVPIAFEHMIGGGATDLEMAVLDWIAEGFSRSLNLHGTTGDGNRKLKGVVADAGAGATTATNSAVDLAAVRKWLTSLTEDVISRDGTMAMMTLATESAIAGLVKEDDRDFGITPEGRLVLPYGVGIPQWNVNVAQIAASAVVGVAGDFRQYAKVYVGAMRFGRWYDQLSDTTLVSFFQICAGKVVRPEAFKKLTVKT